MREYDKEFKKEVAKKYLVGQSVAVISRETGVNENTIHTAADKPEVLQKDGETDKVKPVMRKRIIELETKNEILKKAAIIFERGS
jgi:transposase-like protein